MPRERFGDYKFRAEGQDRQTNTHTRSTVEVPPELKNNYTAYPTFSWVVAKPGYLVEKDFLKLKFLAISFKPKRS